MPTNSLSRDDVIVLRVVSPMIYPLPAAVGDAIAIWPGHKTHALSVVRPDHRIRAHRAATAHELRLVARQLHADRTAQGLTQLCRDRLASLANAPTPRKTAAPPMNGRIADFAS